MVEIGREFGSRHHTTALHSINKIEAMRRPDEALNRTIAQLVDAVVAGKQLPQLCLLGLGLFQDGDVGVGLFR